MFIAVAEVLLCNGAYEGVTGVTVREEGADGEQNLGDGECRTPVVLQDVKTDGALAVDVAMVNASAEHHLQQEWPPHSTRIHHILYTKH